MTSPGLSRRQESALLWEMGAARQLLQHTIALFSSAHGHFSTLNPMFTTGSIGVEKLLKLTIGYISLAAGRPWPDFRQSRYRHRLITMDKEVRQHVRTWVAQNPTGYRVELVTTVDNDPCWRPILNALDTYANTGRFHHLDQLGPKPPDRLSPEGLWEQVELQAVEASIELTAKRAEAISGPPEAFDEFLYSLEARIAQSIFDWWLMIARVGMHGAFGQPGRKFGSEMNPDKAWRPV
ncbi:hypothetical protein [Georgenia muralis]